MSKEATLFVRQDIGKGNPIVLLHGMFADGTQWQKIAKILQKQYRVISVDLLGHGKSPRPQNATYSAAEHVAYLRRTLESLHATQHVTIVGYSMGGAVALSYAKTYEQEVDQLYLLSTPFYLNPDQMIAANYTGSLMLTKLSTGLYSGLEKLLGSGRIDWLLRFGNRSKTFGKMIGAHENNLESEIVRKNLRELVHNYDFAGYLRDLSVPTTFYTGSSDPFIVQGQLNALKQFNSHMYVERLDIIKIDHMLVQNLPKQIAALVSANHTETLHVGADAGTGRPLVLLHGIESSSDYWRGIIPALAETRRVIALDLLGFGQSPKPLNIAYSLDDQVRWIQQTLTALNIDTYDVLGHSLGSLVALALAAAEPDKVKSLILIAPVFISAEEGVTNRLTNRIKDIQHFSDSSVVYSRTAQAIGDKRIAKYLPFLRTIENAVNQQNSRQLAQRAAGVPTKIIYGAMDPLTDTPYIRTIAALFKQADITVIPRVSHNFALYRPELLFEALDIETANLKHRPERLTKVPPSFAKQLVKLATPVLWLKSVAYIGIGLLLFTRFAPWVLTIGLALFVVTRGYKLIRGAFSLRNEQLSYIGYVLLGGAIVAVGYGLLKHPDTTIKIAVFTICGLVLLNGIMRLIVGGLWTRNKGFRNMLLLSGSLMTILGLLALAGGAISIHIIVYTIAVMTILYGIQFGVYACGAFAMAYVRGFNIRS